MKTLIFGEISLNIFSKQNILDLGKKLYNKSLKMAITNFQKEDLENNYNRLLKESIPYNFFRLNELSDYQLVDCGVEISEDQYMERLEQLPPKSFNYGSIKGWVVNECITENIYEHLFMFKNKYYCVNMRLGRLIK